MILTGVLVFSIVSTALFSLLIGRYERFEKTELMSYLLLFVWGAFLLGIYVARPATGTQLVGLFR